MKGEFCFFNFVIPVSLLQTLMVCFTVAVANISTDQLALLALKAHISDPPMFVQNNWSTTASVCTWIGVTCGVHHRRVTALNLSGMGLHGKIPSEIGNLSFLSFLSIKNNFFYGPLPNELGYLFRLKYVDFGFNFLSGSIPSTLYNISAMKTILMSANWLTGNLPATMGLFLPNLVELRLSGNVLEGKIPISLANASMLTFIDLSNNSFSGPLPTTFGNLKHLQLLLLSANDHLTGESFTSESSFVSSLTSCKHLRKIDLSGVSLSASLSVSIGNLSIFLEQFVADNCNIKGSIPREIGNLTNLIALSLANNQLTGTIPTTIGSLKKLQGLRLHGNKLQGNITYDLCYLENLFDLSLGGNEFFGSIPECFGNLTTLRCLNLSSNNFTSIPLSLWSLNDTLVINMSSNSLSGSIPSAIAQLKAVEVLDLSRNRLNGEIPRSIWSLNMAFLSLSKNRLQGTIPALNQRLEFLDLSCNNLSGLITKSDALFHLKYFNLSFNELEGEVPVSNFSANSYMMNKGVCGAPQEQYQPYHSSDLQRCLICELPPSDSSVRRRSVKDNQLISYFLGLISPCVLVASSTILCLRRPIRKVSATMSEIESLGTRTVKRFSYLEFEQATDGFSRGNLLGTGHFDSVYKGTLQDGMVVAIKVFKMDEERSLRSFDVERKVMGGTGHRNLIRLLCSCSLPDCKALVMEYMANGSLEKWLYTHNYHLDILQRLDIMIDVASAVKYLHYDHSRPIVHCDLKPSNILLDEDMIARVCDFSIADIVLDPDEKNPTIRSHIMCTIGYVAPECGLYGIVSTKTDVYSFGVMLMETFTRKRPTDEMFGGEMSLRSWVIESLPDEVNKVVDPSLLRSEEEHFSAKTSCLTDIMRLAQGCTAESPAERFSILQVVQILSKIKDLLLKDIS